MPKNITQTDILIVMGDMNARIGEWKYADIIDRYGVGKNNDTGEGSYNSAKRIS